MSLLTGREPHRQDCWTNNDILPSGIPTFAHSLGAAGYRTALIGRLHSIGPDQLRGFTSREIGDHSTNWIGGVAHDLGILDKANDPYRESLRNSGAGQCSYELHDRDVTAAAVAHLEQLGREGGEAPFAMMVGWLLPHAPYVCAPDLYDHYAGNVPPPHLTVPDDEHEHYAWWRHNRGIADPTPEEILRTRAAYYGMVDALDGMVGSVLDALERAGLADNTIVVYTSDHGEHIGNRGLWWKSTLYDESAKVPMIISWPGQLASGERRSQVCGLIDLTSTLLDAAGAPALPFTQGRSLLPILLDDAAPWINQTFSEYVNDGAPSWSGGRVTISRMVRRDQWKLIYHRGQRTQLFDLTDDPFEEHDLAGRAAYAAVEQRIAAGAKDRVERAAFQPGQERCYRVTRSTYGTDHAFLFQSL
jgi:choline-sulfatase